MSRQAKRAIERTGAETLRSQIKIDARKLVQDAKAKRLAALKKQRNGSPAAAVQIAKPFDPNTATPKDWESIKYRELTKDEAYALAVWAHGPITRPTRFEQAPLPANPIKDSEVHEVEGGKHWLFDCHEHRDEQPKCKCGRTKVTLESTGAFNCSCHKWMRKKNRDCAHIAKIKKMKNIDTVFAQAQRRGPTFYFLPGERAYETRLDDGRNAWYREVPMCIETLCHLYVEEPAHEKGGAVGIPMKVQAFALLCKIARNLSKNQLVPFLEDNMDALWRLGWKKDEAPCYEALSRRWNDDDEVEAAIDAIIIAAAEPCCDLDDGFLGDGYEITNVVHQNSRDRKFGPKPPAWRSKRPMVRTVFLGGNISGAIYAADHMETVNLGSGESPHFPFVLDRAKSVNPRPTWSALDQGYASAKNFRATDKWGMSQYIRKKDNESEDRAGPLWPASATQMAVMERTESEKYDEIARFSPKREATPKRIKDFADRIRLRKRRADPDIVFPKIKGDLADQPDDVIAAIHELQAMSLGTARRKENKSILAVANIRTKIVWSYVLDQDIDFGKRTRFSALRTIKAQDLFPKM